MTDDNSVSISESRTNAKSINNQLFGARSYDGSEEDQDSNIDTSSCTSKQAKVGYQPTEPVAMEEPTNVVSIESEGNKNSLTRNDIHNGDAENANAGTADSTATTDLREETFVEEQITNDQSNPVESTISEHRLSAIVLPLSRANH